MTVLMRKASVRMTKSIRDTGQVRVGPTVIHDGDTLELKGHRQAGEVEL